ncbi:MAG: 5'/3'-nucleotidase SurE [Thermodesulfobacteriota bacterium]
MKVLLTNDDGIHAPGLLALCRYFYPKHEVVVIAPERQRSAVGHAITLHKPIRCESVVMKGGFQGYSVSGTPADCVKLGILELLKRKPDVVISGINPGANIGINVNYSGTVCAAREAGLYGILGISVSIDGMKEIDYDPAARFIETLTVRIFHEKRAFKTVLNVNIPSIPFSKIRGVRICRQETAGFEEQFEKRIDPRNRIYYWQGCESLKPFRHDDSDGVFLAKNYITITPLVSDLTDFHVVEGIGTWKLDEWDLSSEALE